MKPNWTCQEVRDRLSAYFDDELPADQRLAVDGHMAQCPSCRAELHSFERLSDLAQDLSGGEFPPPNWEELRARQHADTAVPFEPTDRGPRLRSRWIVLALAAVVSLVAGTWLYLSAQHDRDVTEVFDAYLTLFQTDPKAARDLLVETYDGDRVDPDQAARLIADRRRLAERLPEGYKLDTVHLLRMPCCLCLQANCRAPDGRVLAIFEHTPEPKDWFGNRPQIKTQCHGCPTTLVDLSQGLAADWLIGKRQMTLVGAESLEEVARFVDRSVGG